MESSGSNNESGQIRRKVLCNTVTEESFVNISDLKKAGRAGYWHTLSKAWSEKDGMMKVTKASCIPGHGCIVQTQTYEERIPGHPVISEALVFIHGVRVEPDPDYITGHKRGHRLVRMCLFERLMWEIKAAWSYLFRQK